MCNQLFSGYLGLVPGKRCNKAPNLMRVSCVKSGCPSFRHTYVSQNMNLSQDHATGVYTDIIHYIHI